VPGEGADVSQGKGELKLRIRFADPPFPEDEWRPVVLAPSLLDKEGSARRPPSTPDLLNALDGGVPAPDDGDLMDASAAAAFSSVDMLDDEVAVAWLQIDLIRRNNVLAVRLNRLALNHR
jgi:hypothetical protein